MAKKEKNTNPVREAKAIYGAPVLRRFTAPGVSWKRRGAYRNEELADSIRYGYTISVLGRDLYPPTVKPRSKRGWPNGGKSFRKLAEAKAASEAKAARYARMQAQRDEAHARHIAWLTANAKALPPEEQLDFLSQHTRPAIATKVMDQLAVA